MDSTKINLGGFAKPIPLISFHCIIDEDISLIKYVILNYNDNKIFNLDKIKDMTFLQIIGELYRRKYSNPLYFLCDDESQYELLDRCYKEFIEEKEADILQEAVKTEMYNVVKEFKRSGDIIPYILCYNDIQLNLLNSFKDLSNIEKIKLDDINKQFNNKVTQYYFKYIDECKPFYKLEDKTFYFSSTGVNLTENNDDLYDKDNIFKSMIYNRNYISIFDIYRMDLIGQYNVTENE